MVAGVGGAPTGDFRPVDLQSTLALYETTLHSKNGGDDKTQTCDIRLAKPTLYQLSYTPKKMAGLLGLEPRVGFPDGFLPHCFRIVVWALSSSYIIGGRCKVSTHSLVTLLGIPMLSFRVHRISRHFQQGLLLEVSIEQSAAIPFRA